MSGEHLRAPLKMAEGLVTKAQSGAGLNSCEIVFPSDPSLGGVLQTHVFFTRPQAGGPVL